MSYILFDAHNFYVSAELVFRPDLLGRPVVVIGSNDGCVISRSQKAKDIGIKMGEPAHFVREEFWRDRVKFFSANFPLYGDMSARMMSVIDSLVPRQIAYSVDEVFATCSGMSPAQLDALATQVRHQVLQYTGLPIGSGIAPTLTLAKVASYLAKRVYRTDSFAIYSDEQRLDALRSTPVGEVWGVGPAYSAKLTAAGVSTAHELAMADPADLLAHFPVGMRRTQIELQGTSAIDIGDPSVPRQMINVGRSFGQAVETLDELAPAFASFAMIASEKLNRQRSVCGALRAYLRPASGSQVRSGAVTSTFEIRTGDPRAIAGAAVDSAARLFRTGVQYSKGGICLFDLDQPDQCVQSSLFDTHDVDGSRISTLMTGINGRFGRGTLSVARTLGSNKWKPKAEMLSGTSTTDITKLPVAF
ncbi:Y-family DNA polymerase [Cobetia marina]|uniref:Y-family DNA polymerase n=1 Tax=Cobetia marina TaxID=28258 RepID=UPI003A8DE82D